MIFTASWSSLYRANQYVDDLPVQPVSISRGLPRYWQAAQSFPTVEALMPDHWMFGVWKKDIERGDRCFRRKLHTIGLQQIRSELDELAELAGKPLALCCHEPDHRDCHRGQVALWWERKTGEPIFDLALVTSRRGDCVTLCHEVHQ
jgi:hypothetical protein